MGFDIRQMRMGFPQRIRTVRLSGVVTRYASRLVLLAAFLWLSCLPCGLARFSQANYGMAGNWQRYFGYDDENQLTAAQAPGKEKAMGSYPYNGQLQRCKSARLWCLQPVSRLGQDDPPHAAAGVGHVACAPWDDVKMELRQPIKWRHA